MTLGRSSWTTRIDPPRTNDRMGAAAWPRSGRCRHRDRDHAVPAPRFAVRPCRVPGRCGLLAPTSRRSRLAAIRQVMARSPRQLVGQAGTSTGKSAPKCDRDPTGDGHRGTAAHVTPAAPGRRSAARSPATCLSLVVVFMLMEACDVCRFYRVGRSGTLLASVGKAKGRRVAAERRRIITWANCRSSTSHTDRSCRCPQNDLKWHGG